MKSYSVLVTKPFQKKYQKLLKKNSLLEKSLRKIFDLLESDPFYPSLKTHKVNHSIYGELYSSWVTGDIRIIWNFAKNKEKVFILALDIGGHSTVYR